MNRKLLKIIVLIIVILVVGGLSLGPVLSIFAPQNSGNARPMKTNMKGHQGM